MEDGYYLKDVIVLDGKVDYCDTYDDCCSTIGVKSTMKLRRFNGEVIEQEVGQFPFTQIMADKYSWSDSYASVQMLIGDTPIDMEHFDETLIASMEGLVDSEYYHYYSELTGYLGTKENWVCGGHDIPKILKSHIGEYIHLEIELYRKLHN